jgi:hypothetical protein
MLNIKVEAFICCLSTAEAFLMDSLSGSGEKMDIMAFF